MSFVELVDEYVGRIRKSIGRLEVGPPATEAQVARAEEILGHRLPEEARVLYERFNGTDVIFPNYGFLLPLPTTYREAFDEATWAAGAPFSWLEQLPLIASDHDRFLVALGSEHRGQVWRVVIDVDPPPVVRVAHSIEDLFAGWIRLLDDGVLEVDQYGTIQTAIDWPDCFDQLLSYWPDINPLLATPDIPPHHEHVGRQLCLDCGVDPDHDSYPDQEAARERLEILLESVGEGRQRPDPEQEAHTGRIQAGFMEIIARKLSTGRDPSVFADIQEEMGSFFDQYQQQHGLDGFQPADPPPGDQDTDEPGDDHR